MGRLRSHLHCHFWAEQLPGVFSTQRANGVHDILQLKVVHVWKNRQADQPLPYRSCNREIIGTPAKRFLVIRMEVQRPPVNGESDSRLAELRYKIIAADPKPLQAQLNRKQVPGMDAVATCRAQFDGLQITQHFKIACAEPFAVVPHLSRTRKLMDANTPS